MSEEYFELERATVIDDPRELIIPRVLALFDAIRHHRDFNLIGLSRLPQKEGDPFECLIVEVTCDGVPPKNAYGLQYREQIALLVRPERGEVPQVLSLRKSFPRLAHQNRVALGSPAHLCLYFEPTSAVLRTWTPELFLRRIQWWFEKNARGELHLSDQPLDHLFFSSKYELVVPWNFDELRKTNSEFIIAQGEARTDGGVTYFLVPKNAATSGKITTAISIEVTLPSVVNGAVEIDPATLGQLSDMLQARGVELLPLLVPKFRELVNEKGASSRVDKPFTVILMHIPICREPGGEPEKIGHRAFVLLNDPLNVGMATGALMVHDGKHYSTIGVMSPPEATAWQDEPIMPIEVLHANTSQDARIQSGIPDAGPMGVVVGAGTLGSALINLWGRSGWGQWTVVDKDHLKPHNLSRHSAMYHQIGESKVSAVADLHRSAVHGASELTPIVADACDAKNENVTAILSSTNVVIDASASLEYPRYASTIDAFARHASIFITPSANACVALVENAGRNQRLRTLEAQYYRAMIQNDWGSDHLTGNLSTFWSGASCRDISMVMPYAKVMSHASTFAEQVPRLVTSDKASIRVWQRSDDDGGLSVHNVLVENERSFRVGALDVFLDSGIECELRDFRRQGFPNETGGVLLGYYDFNVNSLMLVAALPAPPDSKATPGSFERGIKGLKAIVDEAARRTAGIVGYVGEWHSHPPGHSASPSRDDWIQVIHLALGMGDDGLPGVQLIVGENDLRFLTGSTTL